MNCFMRYDHGTVASAFFEHRRFNEAHFRTTVHDSRVDMYKTNYKKDYEWPENLPKPCFHPAEPKISVIPKLDEEKLKKLYTPKVIYNKLGDNKRIEPPLDYGQPQPVINDVLPNFPLCYSTLYKDSYTWKIPVEKITEESLDERVQRWKNECKNLRESDDLVQDFCHRIIGAQKVQLNRKKLNS
ncbi:uncharacterized protein LOC126841168 [Adelges cooleyi]|uniref:uncharacterized protein LOC126841168 n=1 Tax=Adelges cooleyi TaxID=133065 RepID=UPI00217F9D96|nr:uncharacterized protein LOC126841168 [Adelges cooleyi]